MVLNNKNLSSAHALSFFVQRMHCIAYQYCIVTTQLLDTDTLFQVYRTSLVTSYYAFYHMWEIKWGNFLHLVAYN